MSCAWFFESLYSKAHPCRLLIPETLVRGSGEPLLLYCDVKGNICAKPRASINHMADHILAQFPADSPDLCAVAHLNSGQKPLMMTVPEFEEWMRISSKDQTTEQSLALLQVFLGNCRSCENPVYQEKPLPHAVTSNAAIVAKYTYRNSRRDVKVLCQLKDSSITRGFAAAAAEEDDSQAKAYVTCKAAFLRNQITSATVAAITQVEGTRGMRVGKATLKFVAGRMTPRLVWGAVEAMKEDVQLAFGKRLDDNGLEEEEEEPVVQKHWRKTDLCQGDFCTQRNGEPSLVTHQVAFRAIALARVEEKAMVNYFAPARSAGGDWEDAAKDFRITPAILMGSALEDCHSADFYRTVGVCEQCFLTYDDISLRRDKIQKGLTTHIEEQNLKRVSLNMADQRLRRNSNSAYDCGINYWCKLGHGHPGECSTLQNDRQVQDREARHTTLTRRSNFILPSALPKSRQARRDFDPIPPDLTKIKAAEVRWIARQQKGAERNPKGAGTKRLPARRPMSAARRSVSAADAVERLTKGLPSTDDVFTRRPASAKVGRANVKRCDGPVDLISTPRLMASLDDFARAHRSVSYTHLRAHETVLDLVCRLLLEKKKT
eukprot:TRINITY_DN2160_c0_g1_i6.p1 TRINITY_DN2160_c0_g1~~TRINITY_DN2160_c0_g1_i6.p1  ORF type:complete len:603 (+),score=79.60 TRINITY_DN2160_c0_g1_i6:227-2035(+)